MTDTIFALSSGSPPAAIAVVRISGPDAIAAAEGLAGTLPPPRTAGLRGLRDPDGALLDRALVLVFPGPTTATGEDLAELHCHGGRAVVAAVAAVLVRYGLRRAEPGEFTRRALSNGRIDLAQAESLADLLAAETEAQRVAALAGVEGRVGQLIRDWSDRVANSAAVIEAMLDFADEDDVTGDEATIAAVCEDMEALADEIERTLRAPSVERLRDGARVVIAGPPNAGKSTLLNLLAERQAAIVSPIAGTTRDRIEATICRDGAAYLLIDTAGLTATDDPIEAIGVERAEEAIRAADLVVWLGEEVPPVASAIWVQSRADMPGRDVLKDGRVLATSNSDPTTIDRLWMMVTDRVAALTRPDPVTLRAREREACAAAAAALVGSSSDNTVIVAEQLRTANRALATALGRDATEVMLDHLFGRFCVGK